MGFDRLSPHIDPSKFVRSSTTQVDDPSCGHFIEPVERDGPAPVAQQFIMDWESF